MPGSFLYGLDLLKLWLVKEKVRIMTNNIVADINHILDVIAIINQATSE